MDQLNVAGIAQAGEPTFLEYVLQTLTEIQAASFRITSRLSERGFYGPPSPAPDAVKQPEQPNTLRYTIADRLSEIQGMLSDLEYQVDHLA